MSKPIVFFDLETTGKSQNPDDVRIIELPKFLDARGNLSFAEQNNLIPFEIKRTYWVYEVRGTSTGR